MVQDSNSTSDTGGFSVKVQIQVILKVLMLKEMLLPLGSSNP